MPRNKVIFLFLLLLLLGVDAAGQSLTEQQKKRDRLEQDIAILRKQLQATNSRSEQAISSLNLIAAQKKSRQKLIQDSDATISKYNTQIRGVRKEIHRQEAILDTLQSHYSRLVMGAYKNRDVKIWYMYILSSDSMSQAFRRFGYFKGLASQIQVQARKIDELQNELNATQAELLTLLNQEKKVRDEREAEYKRLKENEKEQEAIVNKLKKDSRAYKASLSAKQKEVSAINRQISKMLEEASKKASKNKYKNIDYTLADAFEKNKGKLPWPVEGPVSEPFGNYRNEKLKLSLFNNGINIACESSSKVKAVFNGVVSNVMLAPGYGQCILIQHGNYYTTYCKVKNVSVHQGDKVTTGQVIGEVSTIMGKTQLYFLIWKKNYLNPEEWLRPR